MTSYIILTCNQDYKYLQNCLKSINVLKGEKEIVVVNNGSEEILDSITKGYNLNCFEGRRFGFENSSGEYVRFVDADDLVLNEIDETKYTEDVIQCSFRIKNFETESGYDLIAVPRKNILKSYRNGLWSRVFKRDFLERVYFESPKRENLFWSEDRILMEKVLSLRPSIAFNPEVIYQYNEFRSASRNPKKYDEELYGSV